MAEHKSETISPTVNRILDEYIAALHADADIDNEAANRLDALLRNGKVPKFEDIDAALFPAAKGCEP